MTIPRDPELLTGPQLGAAVRDLVENGMVYVEDREHGWQILRNAPAFMRPLVIESAGTGFRVSRLAPHREAKRKVHSAPKKGSVSRATAKKAVRETKAARGGRT